MAADGVPLTCFVSRHILDLAADETKIAAIESALASQKPFAEVWWTAVLLIDISGYSKLTARLAVYGKISSELITNAVRSYMSKIIHQVVQHNGDVVKFLGDALLVAFRSSERHRSVESAIQCAISIMTLYPVEPVDLTLIRENQRFLNVDDLGDLATVDATLISENNMSGALINPSTRPELEESRVNILAKKETHDTAKKMASTLMKKETRGLIKNETPILTKKDSRKADGGTYRLMLHMAIVVGDVEHIILGMPQSRMDYAMYGPCIRELDALLGGARSGEIAVQSDAWRFFVESHKGNLPFARVFENGFLIRVGDPSQHSPTESILPERALVEALPNATDISVLSTKGYQFLSKFINKSILNTFGGVDSLISIKAVESQYRHLSIIFVKLPSTFDGMTAQAAVSSFVKFLDAAGGVFQQYSVDDKGQTMLACVGLPPYTHENVSEQALKCTLDYLKTPSGKLCVGAVTTGTILFTRIGSKVRSEASLLGNIVNIAARFLGLATTEHPLVCDEATATAATAFRTELLGRFALKGSVEEQEVWFVNGEVETGVEILAKYLEDLGEDPNLYPLLSHFFRSTEYADNAVTKDISGDSRNEAVVRIACKIVQNRCAKEKLVLIFDDVQWADYLSLEILSRLRLFNPQLLLCLFSRPIPEQKRRELEELASLPDTHHIGLNGLADQDISSMILGLFASEGAALVDSKLFEFIRSTSSKNPLALQLALDILISKDCLECINGVVKLSDASFGIEKVLSDVVGAGIMMQFDKLSSEFQTLLHHASIYGQYFDIVDVKELSDMDRDVDSLIQLILNEDRSSFLVHDHGSTDTSFYFRHISISTIIYESLSFSRREQLHRRAAEILERNFTKHNREVLLPQVYHHYSLTTSSAEKRIQYSEELGKCYVDNMFTKEAFAVFQNLCRFIEGLDAVPPPFSDTIRQARWYNNLAKAALDSSFLEVTLTSCLKALSLLNFNCPSPQEYRPANFGKALREQFSLFRRTKSGKILPKECRGNPTEIARRKEAELALGILFLFVAHSDDIDVTYKIFIATMAVNAGISISAAEPEVWAIRALVMSWAFLVSLFSVSKIYFRAAKDAWERSDRDNVGLAVECMGMILFATYGDCKELRTTVEEFREVFQRKRDRHGLQVIRLAYWMMEYKLLMSDVESSYEEHIQNADTFNYHTAIQSLALILNCALVMDRHDILDPALNQMDRTRKKCVLVVDLGLPPFRIEKAYGSVPMMYEAITISTNIWLAIRAGNPDEAFTQFQRLGTTASAMAIYNTYLFPTITAFMSIFHFLLLLRRSPDNRKTEAAKFLAILREFRVPFKRIARFTDTSHAIVFLEGAAALLNDRRWRAKRLFRELLKGKAIERMKVGTPYLVGFVYIGLWIAEGDTKALQLGCQSFAEAKAVLFLNWITAMSGGAA
ncbi:hypothetical protein HDU96_008043 [Phlyctochytrium bullatum]|nr:hypothetical protein HDU96_008043 [Phlyctochytrium bullatum]